LATVRTVLGEISPDDLGITLSHEHLLLDPSHLFWHEPSTSDPLEIHTLAAAPVTPQNSADVAARPYISKDNLRMTELDVAIRELPFRPRRSPRRPAAYAPAPCRRTCTDALE